MTNDLTARSDCTGERGPRLERVRMLYQVPQRIEPPQLPPGFRAVDWSPDADELHARALADVFAGSTDARFFPRLRTLEGCRLLVDQMVSAEDFAPKATFLVLKEEVVAGFVQARYHTPEHSAGELGNLGVMQTFRSRGLGLWLVMASVLALAEGGARTVDLHTSADNTAAIALYSSFGFSIVESYYL